MNNMIMPIKGRECGCVYIVLDKTVAVYLGTGTRVMVNADGTMKADHGHVYLNISPHIAHSKQVRWLRRIPLIRTELTLMNCMAGKYTSTCVLKDYLPVEMCLGNVTGLGLNVDMDTQRFSSRTLDGKHTEYVLMDEKQNAER